MVKAPARRNRILRKIGKTVASAVANGVAFKAGHSYTSRKDQKFSGQQATTDEKETKVLYRRKNKGQGKKAKRQINFRRKVQNALRQELGSQVVHFYDNALVQSTAGTQTWASVTLFPGSGLAGTHDDLANLFVKYMNWGVGYGNTSKLMVNSGYLDCTLSVYSEAANVLAVVDVYTCVFKRGVTDSTAATPEDQMLIWESEDSLMPGTTVTNPSIYTPFWTPFNSPSITQRLTVLSKRRLLLSSGKSMTLSMGGRMHRRISFKQTQETTFIPGITKIMLFCLSGRTVNPASTTDVNVYPAVNLNLQWSRTYNFDVLQDNKSTVATEAPH